MSPLRLSVDENGLPHLFLRDPASGHAWIGDCASPACGTGRLTPIETAPGAGVLMALPALRPTALLVPGSLRLNDGAGVTREIPLSAGYHGGGVLATAGSGIYALTAENAPPQGLQLTIGAAEPDRSGLTLWHCADWRCDEVRRITLGVVDGQVQSGGMAVGADARVLVVLDDQNGRWITLVSPGPC